MRPIRLILGAGLAIVAAPVLLWGAMRLMHSVPPGAVIPPTPKLAAAEVSAFERPAHPLLGVFEIGTPKSYAPVSKFGKAVHHKPRLVLLFTGVGSRFPAAYAQQAHRHGATLLIQINPGKIPLRQIASGAYDGWISGYARQVARFGHPVVIGFGHEMNGHWYPWGYTHQPASAFKAAWRHIVTVFRRQHANGVIWLWTISHHIRYTAPLRTYWPGSRYVDWVGIDGYYVHRSDNFRGVFGKKISEVRKITKDPILLAEVAIGPAAGRTAKLPGLFAGIISDNLAGLVWFDVRQHGGLLQEDWRLEGHGPALGVFRRGIAKVLAHHR